MLESLLTCFGPKGAAGSKDLQPEVCAGKFLSKTGSHLTISRQLNPPSRSNVEFSLLLQAVHDVAGEASGTSVLCEPHLPVTHHGAFLTPDVL